MAETATVVGLGQIDPISMVGGLIKAANQIGTKIKASKSDQSEVVKDILETSTDEKIVKYRGIVGTINEKIATLQAQLVNGEAGIKAHALTLVPGIDVNFDVDAATKEFLGKRKSVHDAMSALETFFTKDQISAALKSAGIAELIDLRGARRGGGSVSQIGIKRPRISEATLNGEPVAKKDGSVDFVSLAKSGKSDAETLKTAAFASAGTQDLNSLTAGSVVSFKVGDNSYTVTVSAKKPGRPAKPAEEVAEVK